VSLLVAASEKLDAIARRVAAGRLQRALELVDTIHP
jgi:hypothetical protein